MHAPAPEHLTCLSCGYDLRGAGSADGKCPECGFLIGDSVAGHARAAGRWAWKVRVGLLLMLLAMPPLIVAVLTYTQMRVVGMPLTLLNFPGPKVWGVPLVRMFGYGAEDVWTAVTLVALIVNTCGIYLLTTPAAAREPMFALRRWLRVHAVAATAAAWLLVTPWWGWPAELPGSRQFDAPTLLLLIELPGTYLFYLYLAQLSRQQLHDPQMARRALTVLKAAVPLQVLGVIAASDIVRVGERVDFALLVGYGAAALGLALWALDLNLDLYRALANIEPEPARG